MHLLQSIAAGDEVAFADLFYAYKDKLYSFLLRLTDEALAEDIVQEVFLKIWRERERLSSVSHASAYIFRMAKNEAVNHLRRSVHLQSILQDKGKEMQINTAGTQEVLSGREVHTQIKEAVDQLPPQQKKVYLLSREEGLKLEEIAEQLGISLYTVKNHLVQALRNLRDKLGADDPAATITLILSIAELLKG